MGIYNGNNTNNISDFKSKSISSQSSEKLILAWAMNSGHF